MIEITYPAVRVFHEEGGKPLLLFAAPAVDIDKWVGVPQKLKLGDDETAGFQRTVSPTRRNALQHFFGNPENVMQNPLLCAIRNSEGLMVSFEAINNNETSEVGLIRIKRRDLIKKNLVELLNLVKSYLEERVPGLSQRQFPEDLYRKIEDKYRSFTDDYSDNQEEISLADDVTAGDNNLEEALFDDSQIAEFWDQIVAREKLATKLGSAAPANELVGFSREVLEAYLRPIVLVDGQHRLAGAVEAAKVAVENDPKAKEEAQLLIANGATADEALALVMKNKSRLLPVSLLLDDSPAEHVFQFVVVNQKATPVPKALLGTIISTSLAPNELSSIKDRLIGADIALESSQAVSSLSRSPVSPFADKVARGFEQDTSTKLPWTVLASLAELFRSLRGAKYYHEPTLDHADVWKEHHLEGSPIVADWQARDFRSAYAYWADANGPWRDVFIAFWTAARDKLADVNDPDAHNFWGNPRKSNIFNKPSLVILSTDFFSFLREQRTSINSVEHIKDLVDEWLRYVSITYFSKDWRLVNVKKDSVGTRKQWSYLWYRHRSSGVIPKIEDFGKLKRD